MEVFSVTSQVLDRVLQRTLDPERKRARWVAGDRPDFNGMIAALSR